MRLWILIKSFICISQALIAHGADIDTQSSGGRTPLILAARENHLAVVTTLISSGKALTCELKKRLRFENPILRSRNIQVTHYYLNEWSINTTFVLYLVSWTPRFCSNCKLAWIQERVLILERAVARQRLGWLYSRAALRQLKPWRQQVIAKHNSNFCSPGIV